MTDNATTRTDKRTTDPYPSFRFAVYMGNETTPSAGFMAVSSIRARLETKKVTTSDGATTDVPQRTVFDPITLTSGVIGNSTFLKWVESIIPKEPVSNYTADLAAKTIHIALLNEKGKRTVEWTLKHAFPIAYAISPMNALSSGVLMESITLSFDGMERERKGIDVNVNVENSIEVILKQETGEKKPVYKFTGILIGSPGYIQGTFTQVSGLGMEITYDTFSEGGRAVTYQFMRSTKLQKLVLKQGVVTGLANIFNGVAFQSLGMNVNMNGYVTLDDPNGNTKRSWIILGARITKYVGPELSSGTAYGATAVDTIELSYNGTV